MTWWDIFNLIWPENVKVDIVFISYEHCHGVCDHSLLISESLKSYPMSHSSWDLLMLTTDTGNFSQKIKREKWLTHCSNTDEQSLPNCNESLQFSIIVFYVWSRILREFLWVCTEHASVITTKLLRFNDSSWSTSPLITLSENNITHVSPEIFAALMISMTLERSGIRHWWLSSWISSSGDWGQSLLSLCLSLTPPSVLPVLSSSEPAPFTILSSHSKYW